MSLSFGGILMTLQTAAVAPSVEMQDVESIDVDEMSELKPESEGPG